MGAFWHWFIAVFTIAFVVWCVWLVQWSSKQGPSEKSDDELVGHRWDGDLEEWNNPAPRWWLYLYFITIGFAVVYMIAFPGLGSFDGLLGWSQAEQYEEEMQLAREKYEPIYAQYAAMPFEEMKANEEVHRLGGALYATYCTTCHGSDARGATGYPNLTDSEWQYGNAEAQIVHSIAQGRNGIMPALGPALGGEEGIDNMVNYVLSLSGAVEADAGARGAQPLFVALCSACHGVDGKGNEMLGGPNLTNDIWLYGGSPDAIRYSLVNGRNGVMPAHGNLLGDSRLRILAAWVAGLPDRQ